LNNPSRKIEVRILKGFYSINEKNTDTKVNLGKDGMSNEAGTNLTACSDEEEEEKY
jgi:hypothetical protein